MLDRMAIAGTLIVALLVQPLAALAMPCCCNSAEIPAKACCAHHAAAAQPAKKSCCAKHAQPVVKLQRGCCCSVGQLPANIPTRDAVAKPQFEHLVWLPLEAFAAYATPSIRLLQVADLSPTAHPPSVNVLFCTWQI